MRPRRRELRLSNLELSVRLGETEGVEPALRSALDEALTAGDRNAVLRARVSLASLALERDAFADAATLLEATVAGEAFSAIDRFDIFANLGRAYAGSGHPERAAELFQECIAAVEELGGDPSVEARYATLLSYALTDMGEIARAEEVVPTRSSGRRTRRPVHACPPLLVDRPARTRRGTRLRGA